MWVILPQAQAIRFLRQTTAAALRAIEINAEAILATKADGIYSADPVL